MSRGFDAATAQLLRTLMEGTLRNSGSDFYRSLTRTLAEALEVPFCWVSELPDSASLQLRTLALWTGSEFAEETVYDFAETPCAKVLAGEPQVVDLAPGVYPPECPWSSATHGSFAGVPLYGSENEVIGHLAVVDEQRFGDSAPDMSLLAMFAAHAATELERGRTQDALVSTREKYSALFHDCSDAIVLCSIDGTIVDANRQALDLFGYELQDFVGRSAEKQIPESARSAGRFYLRTLNRDRRIKFVLQLLRSDGEEFSADVSCSLLWIAGREVMQSVIRDITEQRRMEQALRDSEARLRQVIDLVPHCIFAKDLHGRFILVNQAVADLHGTTSENIVGKTDTELIASASEAERFRREDLQVLESGEVHNLPPRTVTLPSGELRWHKTIKIPFTFAKSDLPSVLGVSSDITDQRVSEEQRQDLQAQVLHMQKLESLGVLAGGIAHDFNNLLSGILGNVDLLQMSMATDSPDLRFLQEIERAAQRSAELTNQMLAYSGKGDFAIKDFDLNALVREMAGLLRTSISKKAELKFDLADDLGTLQGDPTQVRQVVMNLITNASDALGDQSGSIHLRTGILADAKQLAGRTYLGEELPAGDYVFVEVRDSGCGMDQNTREKLFEPFFTTKKRGRGLGLSSLLGIARGHGGGVRVDSRPGKGSCFTVVLPMRQAGAVSTPAVAVPTSTAWEQGGKILVVDDEDLVRTVARRLLERAGFEVLMAENGRIALEVFEPHMNEIRVVLLDMMMPELDGLETFREMRRLQPSVRAILSSGYDKRSMEASIDQEGFAGFIRKPYRPAELKEELRRVLTQP